MGITIILRNGPAPVIIDRFSGFSYRFFPFSPGLSKAVMVRRQADRAPSTNGFPPLLLKNQICHKNTNALQTNKINT